jgi:hypothetical protein
VRCGCDESSNYEGRIVGRYELERRKFQIVRNVGVNTRKSQRLSAENFPLSGEATTFLKGHSF